MGRKCSDGPALEVVRLQAGLGAPSTAAKQILYMNAAAGVGKGDCLSCATTDEVEGTAPLPKNLHLLKSAVPHMHTTLRI